MTPPSDSQPLHPRLVARRDAIAAALKVDDAVERDAALADIQTLLHRCGYHLTFQWTEQRERALRKRKGQLAVHPRAGRPAGSSNWANRQLGLGLATIWQEQTGTPPTRRLDIDTGIDYGPYRSFVALVLGALPRPIRRTRKGAIPEVDHLVRTSIDEWRAAQASGDQARHRGLLEDDRWEGPGA